MKRWLPVALVALAVVLTAAIATTRRSTGPPYDPTSTSPRGAKAVVVTLERYGADVRVVEGPPPLDGPTAGATALVLQDRLDRDQAAQLQTWVRAGGQAVIADGASGLVPPRAGSGGFSLDRGTCTVPELAPLSRLFADRMPLFEVPDGADRCFGSDRRGYAVIGEPDGAGRLVSVAGPDLWTNEYLGDVDNAALAAALLVPEPGTTVFFVQPLASGIGTGDRTLIDLVESPVRALLFQLLVAFGIVVAWRARRLGRPVPEPVPVEIESSELTRAVGRLLSSNRRPDRAVALLRDRARRELSGPLGLPLDAPPTVVAEVLAARTGWPVATVRRAVQDPVATDAELVEVATALDRLRQEVLHDRSAR